VIYVKTKWAIGNVFLKMLFCGVVVNATGIFVKIAEKKDFDLTFKKLN
jgi:hypothetical protein